MTSDAPAESTRSDFIREIIEADLRTGKHGGRVVTRFPPEPNGYLHIGHAKSICLNFGIAEEYGSHCNLRFDDTNPAKEDVEYVESIERDVRWLGFSFGDRALYASDYFDEMYRLAEDLVPDGKAYVDHLSDDEIKEYRGSLSEPGRPSPYRDRSVEENLDLLRQMRAGVLPDGACVLRARIDLAAPNMKMRDPLLYRIRHDHHHRTGDAWPIYPMYDYAHPISDAIEGVTHSLCTLEFENNRELYDWVIEHTRVSERHGFSRPQQIEFARLNLDYTVLSKRKLLRLVEDGHVAGWDDPRMPTIAGMRRRGYRPEAIRAFADLIGVAKVNSTVDLAKLEFCVRDDLNWTAPRVLGVLRPLKVTITSWPEGEVEDLTAPFFPADVGQAGERTLPFGRELWIDRDDFALDPPAGFQRLAPGRTVRLRHGYCITCDEVVEEGGEVVELRGHHVPGSVGQNAGRAQGVGGDPLGVGRARGAGRGASLRPAVPGAPSGGGRGRPRRPPQPRFVAGGHRRHARAEPGRRRARQPLAAGAGRVLRRRHGGLSARRALVLNRIVTLRDSWQGQSAEGGPPTPEPERREKSDKAKTRPPKRSRVEYRAEARVRDPVLADRFARWPAEHGISEADADLLTGDLVTGDLFVAAVAAGAPPPRWPAGSSTTCRRRWATGSWPPRRSPARGWRAGRRRRVGGDHGRRGQGGLRRDGGAGPRRRSGSSPSGAWPR